MPRYEVLSHTADTGIVAYGESPEEAFANAAFAMFDLVFDLSRVPAAEECRVEVEGETPGELLVAWLSVLLAEAEIRGLAFSSFRVEMLSAERLGGTAAGAPSAGLELRGPPVKAVTYHDLAVEQVPGGWRARVIFDV
jgi:SHS2 domain-containing protein